jgi:peptidoglycan/xylan/chitin deacetylase (PgdA/CDA1 family)
VRRGLAVVAVAIALAVLAYAGDRLYRRSLPTPPAVVTRDANVAAKLRPPLPERVRHAILGTSAEGRIAGPKLIALTFDDGPYPVDTPYLLAALHALHVPGTFFLIGRDARQYPGLVRAIAAGGNEIANHTETHPDLDKLSPDGVQAELAAGAATLSGLVADPAVHTLFRPPHGRFTAATLVAAQKAGYITVLWNDDPGDWRNVTSAELAEHVFAHATRPEILLLHNGRPATVALLGDLVGRFRSAGYAFVTVGEMLERVPADTINRAGRTALDAAP